MSWPVHVPLHISALGLFTCLNTVLPCRCSARNWIVSRCFHTLCMPAFTDVTVCVHKCERSLPRLQTENETMRLTL